MTGRKLHTFVGHCKHYSPARGEYLCDRGLDIRRLVGGPDLGWCTRMPCVTSTFTRPAEQVACEFRELPTAEEVRADTAEMMRKTDLILAGTCPECGSPLETKETEHNTFSTCPKCAPGHVMMMGCKRTGEYQ